MSTINQNKYQTDKKTDKCCTIHTKDPIFKIYLASGSTET